MHKTSFLHPPKTYIFNYSSLNYVAVAKLQFFIFMGARLRLSAAVRNRNTGLDPECVMYLSPGSCPGLVFLFSTRRGGGVAVDRK